MIRWTYLAVDEHPSPLDSGELDRYGADGWELAGFAIDENFHHHYVFKQPIEGE